MANLKDLIVNGAARIIGKVYSSGGFVGNLEGNATNDSAGQQINTTYIKGLSVSGKTITYTKGNGTTGTITTQDTTYSTATPSANGLMSSTDKKKLDHIPPDAEPNQKAFSKIAVGTLTAVETTVEADVKTSTLNLVAGPNITLTADATDNKITIIAKDTTYSVFGESGTNASTGLVPKPSTTAGTTYYLREDGRWALPLDTKVTQTAVTDSDYTNYRPLLWGASSSSTAGFTPSNVTDGVYACKGLYVRPSAGLIHATTFEGTATTATACTGNSATATKLKSSITLKTTDGTNTSTGVNFDGSTGISIPLPSTIKANLTGNVTGNASLITVTARSDNAAFPVLFVASNGTGQSAYMNSNVYINPSTKSLTASAVYGAYWNDLADSIPLGEGDIVEPGYCYCFDGEHYTKTSEYMQLSYIGIHSDTYGFRMGFEEGKEKLDVAVSGFALAYVDKEYPVGTPLTCTKDGYLTEISKEDKRDNPEMVIAKYWKSEPSEEWGIDNRKVKVNGRKWVKIK